MKNDNDDKGEGVADVDDDDNYDNTNKKILLLQVDTAGNQCSCVRRGSAY